MYEKVRNNNNNEKASCGTCLCKHTQTEAVLYVFDVYVFVCAGI